ncbi:SnoaL-like domain-containing protein [Sphingomonas laterariae]|uniref:SnoaL-like domain-containing protein n=1 Tax=Edaphosphingomonas laterariae TaxID=861865 RepID=A0A239BLW9_9SPHN|nr:nuclear transport factor 2 family protein [Sphingomonas laterariae]SNS08348.1 SnoaL-like domain-containing protein [Sphingomonas laterariae]
MSDIQMLIDERAIYRQLCRFAEAMDRREWQWLDDVLMDDAQADYGIGRRFGRASIVAEMRSFLDDCGPTQHLLANVIIDVAGDSATSSAYVADMHVGLGDRSHLTFRTLGDYHDHWVRTADGWRIAERIKHNRAHVGDMAVLGSGPG